MDYAVYFNQQQSDDFSNRRSRPDGYILFSELRVQQQEETYVRAEQRPEGCASGMEDEQTRCYGLAEQ
jgi:hypothetical protein